MGKLRIEVDRKRCVGSGDCVETAPSVFQLDDEDKSEVINPEGAPEGVILAAARGCPVRAITVTDEESGERLFPPAKK